MKALRELVVLGCLVTASCAANTSQSPTMTAAPTTPTVLADEEREWLHLARPADASPYRQRREVTRDQRKNTGMNFTGPGGTSLVTKG